MPDNTKEKDSKARTRNERMKELLLKGSRVDGFNEPTTESWMLPPEMLKPGGPSPLTHSVVPKNKKQS